MSRHRPTLFATLLMAALLMGGLPVHADSAGGAGPGGSNNTGGSCDDHDCGHGGNGNGNGGGNTPEPHDCDDDDCGPPPPPPPPERKPNGSDSKPAEPPLVTHAWDSWAVTAPSGKAEYMLTGSGAEVDRAGTVLARLGVKSLRTTDLSALGIRLLVVDPAAVRPERIRAALAAEGAKVTLSRNNLYRPAGGAALGLSSLLGVPQIATCPLPGKVRVGLIDGPVDVTNPALSGVAVESHDALPKGAEPGSVNHATGLVSLIAGRDGAGVAHGASILSAIAFYRRQGSDLAQADAVLQGLNWLADSDAEVINLSLAGPHNDALAYALSLVAARGTILVAATGNDGAGSVAFPAADPNVIAVTAVDGRKRLYRSANRGSDVDFAAPGVDLSLIENGKTVHRSGTSYAAAIVSAVVAREVARGAESRQAITDALRASAEDLGKPGRDNQFGWGLVRISDCQK